MGTKSESGHAVNAANFSRMICFVEEANTKYNPPDTAISIANLKIAEQIINDSISNFNEAASPWVQAVNAMGAIMGPVDRLMTKVKNLAAVCNVSQQFIKDVTSLVKKIKGVRITPKIVMEPGDSSTPTDASIKQISASQKGVDHKLDNIDKLMQLLKVEANYTPNEDELKVTTINALLTDLKAKRAEVNSTLPHMEAARINRNKVMYTDAGSGAELSAKVKAYFKAVYGGNSQEYHDVARLKFTKLK
jgi:hypothetical protein